jgi:hypothetical protein
MAYVATQQSWLIESNLSYNSDHFIVFLCFNILEKGHVPVNEFNKRFRILYRFKKYSPWYKRTVLRIL